MRPTTLVSVIAIACSVLAKPTEFERHAGSVDVRGVPIKHNHRSHNHQARSGTSSKAPTKLKKRGTDGKKKKCVAKTSAPASATVASSTKPASTQQPTPTPQSDDNKDDNKGNSNSGGGSGGNSQGGPNAGPVHITDSRCGSNNPSDKPGKGTGPNGEEAWFNCGLQTGGGWNPPMMKVEQLSYVPLAQALEMKNSQFGPCKPYLKDFQAAATKYKLPDILLAAIAMQESTCRPGVISAGSHGLFQLSADLCKPYGGKDACMEPHNNADGGAKYIRDLLSQNDGNILRVMGYYNGWYQKMTIEAIKKKGVPCSMTQNFNYLQGIFNGFMQGVDGYNNGNVKYWCNGASPA